MFVRKISLFIITKEIYDNHCHSSLEFILIIIYLCMEVMIYKEKHGA